MELRADCRVTPTLTSDFLRLLGRQSLWRSVVRVRKSCEEYSAVVGFRLARID